MSQMPKYPEKEHEDEFIATRDETILVTGAGGFIGARVVNALLGCGFKRVRCFVRPSSNLERLRAVLKGREDAASIFLGNLLSPRDCEEFAKDASIVLHLAAGMEKSFSAAFMSSVVSTRNLIEAVQKKGALKRFVNVSSFIVYSTDSLRRGGELDESCPLEEPSTRRESAYCFAKIKQEELLERYGREHGLPYVTVRPGAVYGPGKREITARVGINTFGVFLHLGGGNRIPLTHVDNCAEAIVLAGLRPGVDGEVFNIVDDALPKSRHFLRSYKEAVGGFRSIPLPYGLTYLLSWAWEKYSKASKGQLPPVFNRSRCTSQWKRVKYSNEKLKKLLGWQPRVSTQEGIALFANYLREAEGGGKCE